MNQSHGRCFSRILQSALWLLGLSAVACPAGLAEAGDSPSAEELAVGSDLIVHARVVGLKAAMREDARGRHIYTEVTIDVLNTIKGDAVPGRITFETIGGSFGGVTEEVSFSPGYRETEETVLFLKTHPYRHVGGREGKRTIHDGTFALDGFLVTPQAFAGALREFQRQPGAGRRFRAFLSEVGKRIETGLAPAPTPHAAKAPAEKAGPPGGFPQDLGGGRLPAAEIPRVTKTPEATP